MSISMSKSMSKYENRGVFIHRLFLVYRYKDIGVYVPTEHVGGETNG